MMHFSIIKLLCCCQWAWLTLVCTVLSSYSDFTEGWSHI